MVLFAPSSKGPTRLVKYADEKGFREERQLSFFRMQDVTTVVRLSFNDDHGITISLTGGEVRQFICNDGESWKYVHANISDLLLRKLHEKKKNEKVVQMWLIICNMVFISLKKDQELFSSNTLPQNSYTNLFFVLVLILDLDKELGFSLFD